MRVAIRDRTGDLTDESRERAERRLSHLEKVLDVVFEAEVEVTREAGRSVEPVHVVDLRLGFREPELDSVRVRERGRNLGQAVEVAIDHAEFEVAELKERLTDHRRR